MSFIQRERLVLERAMQSTPESDMVLYGQLYAAQQALAWAEDPEGAMSPSKTLLDRKVWDGSGRESSSRESPEAR